MAANRQRKTATEAMKSQSSGIGGSQGTAEDSIGLRKGKRKWREGQKKAGRACMRGRRIVGRQQPAVVVQRLLDLKVDCLEISVC